MRRHAAMPQWSPTIALIIINVAVFVFQTTSSPLFIRKYLALSQEGLSHGYLWQLVTFQFLHGGFYHLLFNLIALYMFGRPVEERLGRAGFLRLYLLSGIIGGLFQAGMGLILPSHFGVHVVGASAGVCGVVAAFAMILPDATLLLFFILPIRAKYFLVLAIVFSLGCLITSAEPGIAHAAHLGGILGGMAYLRWGTRIETMLLTRRPRRAVHRPQQLVKVYKSGTWQQPDAEAVEDLPPAEFISREVDPILEKISAHGIHSLTPRERRILEAARARMRQH